MLAMRQRVVGLMLAVILVPSGVLVLYAADAHPPPTQSCSMGYTGELGTVHLNQDGTVSYRFDCLTAKYSGSVFILLNIVGITTAGVGIKGALRAVRG